MNRFGKIEILEQFTNGGNTYGIYWAEFNGESKRKILIIRNRESLGTISHYMGEPVYKCVGAIRQDVVKEFLEKLADQEAEEK